MKRFVLTKHAYLELPAGVFLASNIGLPPVFAELVQGDRSAQWARIKLAGADNRICQAFRSQHAFEQWLAYATKLASRQ